MPGKKPQERTYFGTKLSLFVTTSVICGGAVYFSGFLKEISSIFGLISFAIVVMSFFGAVAFVYLVFAQLVQHEITAYDSKKTDGED